MKFQICKLILWPVNPEFTPRTIDFVQEKVNVITGDSRTGKTAIIPIIDYCLGSEECSIPIEVIRDNVAWYGLIISTVNKEILLARKAPDGNKSSSEYFKIIGQNISVPNVIIESNDTIDGIKIELNNCANIPYINRGETNGFDNTISFRDASHLCFQSQDIVANQSVLFYKTHKSTHQEKLKRWLPYILGAESRELIEQREKLKELKSLLDKNQKEYDKEKKLSNEWIQRLFITLSDAKFYGLYKGNILEENSQEGLIVIAKQILEKSKDGLPKEITNISLDEDILKVETELDKETEDAALISKRIKNICKIQKTLTDYDDGSKRKVDRLGLSNWLLSNKQESNKCPLCGETSHPYAILELEKICKALRKYEELCTKSVDIPAAVNRELENLQKELDEKQEKIKILEKQLVQCNIKNEENRKYTEKRDMFLKYLGQLEYTVEMIESLTEAGEVSIELTDLKDEIEKINEYLRRNNSTNKLNLLLQKLNLKILETLKGLDVEEKYKENLPSFSIDELSIKVKDDKGDEHLLTEIGSASNWVSFHIALCCALQELLNYENVNDSCVPSFIVFDQPSQVYFPRVGNKDEFELKDNDAEAVRKMFIALSKSIKVTNGAWQAIVLEHADKNIYGDITDVNEVEVWRNGTKLIPEEWLHN